MDCVIVVLKSQKSRKTFVPTKSLAQLLIQSCDTNDKYLRNIESFDISHKDEIDQLYIISYNCNQLEKTNTVKRFLWC